MQLTFIEIENIVKTLPVGYYIGRHVPIFLTNESSSYYMSMQDEIHISYPMINNALTEMKTTLTSQNIENITRSLVYHEVSHAFLTPETLEMTDVINIFEDERIETICKNYYMNTDFNQLLKLVNGWDGITTNEPVSAKDAWYTLVRYHVGKREFLDRVQKIIDTYYELNRFEGSYYLYAKDICKLYDDVAAEWTLTQEKKNKDEDMNKDDDNTNECSGNGGGAKSKDDDDNNKRVLQLFKSAQIFIDNNIQQKVESILMANKKLNANNCSAINAYSGVFNPRSVVRDDYKWFVQQNRQGNVKHANKTVLNLFIDQSGSFYESETTVNKLLYALTKVEKHNSNFEFNLITMDTVFIHKQRNSRQIRCNGGNNIPDEAIDVVKRVQTTHANCYNIVLFDGDAFGYEKSKPSNFRCFNVPNTVMILEESNAIYAEKYSKQTKRIYTENYDSELISQVCAALQILLK